MYKLFNSTILLAIVVIIYNLLYSCAVPGTIDGGDRDSISPVMVKSKPRFLDTNYKENKVFIYFNEFFTLEDINQEFYSSPPFEEIPDFRVRKNLLIVKFNEPLKDSVTYNLNFRNAIADNNEKNVLKDFRFVFSTKSNIDSFSIAGNLRNAFDQTAVVKSTVMAFENHEDSIPYKSLPSYLSITDSSGNFNIDFIQPGSYKLFVLDDKNGNQKADFFEDRAFLDSLIVPKRSTYITIDSLKAGIVLHDTLNNITDSLENDSVIISHKARTSPSNLRLYLFTENNQAQKVLDYARKEKSKLEIFFALPLTSDFKMNPLNFKVEPEDIIIEKNPANDSITWWIANPKIQAMDTLEVNLLYMSKDSIGKPIIANDTLAFEFREKKKDDAWKRKSKEEKVVKIEYLNLNYLLKDGKVNLDKSLRIESPTPLLSVDTSKIKLFEIIDTLTVDTKEQKILKSFRLQKDILTFKFKRPIASEFILNPINFKAQNWYTTSVSDSNRYYTCQITDPSVSAMDTIKLIVDYDNNFFMQQIQALSDSAVLPITAQKIISRKRGEADKINLVLHKPFNQYLKVTPTDFQATPNWYQISSKLDNDTVTIQILDKNVINKDTLTLSVNYFDYIDLKGDSVFLNETMRIVFREKEQYLVGASRSKKEDISLYFNKKIATNPVLEPIGIAVDLPWYQIDKNAEGDTLKIKISNEKAFSKDTLGIILKYSEINRKGKSIEYIDTLILRENQTFELKKKTESGQAAKTQPKAQTVHIYYPTDYKMIVDTMHVRHRLLEKKWKEKTKYLLRLDSMSFINIFNIYNKTEDFEFSTQPIDYYSSIKLSLKNIRPSIQTMLTELLNDSSKTDSLILMQYHISQKEIDYYIGQGNLIVQLLGEKSVLVREFIVSKDQDIEMKFLDPGKYKIRIIFDRNDNGKWDTGDYFKHIQPERVIMNGEDIILKSGFDLELEWPVGESLIKSFTKDLTIKIENFKVESK